MRSLVHFMSLGAVRAADAVYLLLLAPLLIRRLGIDLFGVIMLVQAVLNYGRTVVDYGFNISGVRAAALAQAEALTPAPLLSEALLVRTFNALAVTLLLLIAVQIIPSFQRHGLFFYWGIPILAAHVLFPDWFLVGIQRSPPLALANLAGKAAAALLVFLLVRKPQEAPLFLALTGAGPLAANAALWVFILNRYAIRLFWPGLAVIRHHLRRDFQLLLSNLAIEVNSSFPVIALNFLTDNATTGYFSVLQKLIQPLRFLLVIFSQFLFPKACEHVITGMKAVWALLKAFTLRFAPLPVAACIILAITAGPVLQYFTGEATVALVRDLRLYLAVPLIVLLNIPAYQLLLAYERPRAYSRIYLVGLALNVSLCLTLPTLMGLQGAICCVILIEGFITAGLHWAAARLRREQGMALAKHPNF